MQVNPMVTDLSHWDPAYDYDAVRADGIVAVLYKATEGQSWTDDTYVGQQRMAKAAGLKWGSYHFADASNVNGQIDNYLRFACPDPDEAFCLDWEDNPGGNGMMSLNAVHTWIREVERELHREGECILYSGNTAKEQVDGVDVFLGARRLWHAQYGTSPDWQESWSTMWLWQFTDGVYGPQPHEVDGVGACDINSYAGTASQLRAEWATGSADRPPPPEPDPDRPAVTVVIDTPPGTLVKVRQTHFAPSVREQQRRRRQG